MNKKNMIIIASAVVVVSLIGLGFALSSKKSARVADVAGVAGEQKFAVFSLNRMHAKAKVSRNIMEQRAKYEEQLQKEVDEQKAKFAKVEETLNQQKGVLAQDVLQKKYKEYITSAQEAEKKFKTKAEDLQKSIKTALKELEEKHLRPILEKIVDKNGYKMVFSDLGVIFYAQKEDITDEVTEMLNDEVSKIDVKSPF